MKNLVIIFTIVLFFFTSCSKKIKITQNISNENTILHLTSSDSSNRKLDSVNLILPIEFKLNIKPEDVENFSTQGIINGESKVISNNYKVYNKNGKEKISDKRDLNKGEYIYIIVKMEGFNISFEEAKQLLDFYKSNNTSTDSLIRGSLSVAPYSKIRKDFPFILKRLNKVPDSMYFNFKLAPNPISKTVKIEW